MGLASPGNWMSMAEYENGRQSRALETELQAGVDYTLMTSLAPNVYRQQAFRIPAKMDVVIPKSLLPDREDTVYKIEIPEKASDLEIPETVTKVGKFTVVQFTLINEPTARDHQFNGTIDDGYWREASVGVRVGEINVEEAYFSFDTSGIFDGMDRLLAAANLDRSNNQRVPILTSV